MREHADPHLTCILVGNKIDLCTDSDDVPVSSRRKREVSTEEAELWAKEEGLLFVEASAKSGENVEAAFERATRDILDKVHRGVFDDDRVSAFVAFRIPCTEGRALPPVPVRVGYMSPPSALYNTHGDIHARVRMLHSWFPLPASVLCLGAAVASVPQTCFDKALTTCRSAFSPRASSCPSRQQGLH